MREGFIQLLILASHRATADARRIHDHDEGLLKRVFCSNEVGALPNVTNSIRTGARVRLIGDEVAEYLGVIREPTHLRLELTPRVSGMTVRIVEIPQPYQGLLSRPECINAGLVWTKIEEIGSELGNRLDV